MEGKLKHKSADSFHQLFLLSKDDGLRFLAYGSDDGPTLTPCKFEFLVCDGLKQYPHSIPQLLLLPRIMSDPETKKEMENLQLPKLGGDFDMSEMMTKFLGGGSPAPAPSTSSASGKANKKKN